MISPEKLKILIPLQKMPKNVGDLGRLIVAQALKSCPKSKKSPNLVTLHSTRSRKAQKGLPSFGWVEKFRLLDQCK